MGTLKNHQYTTVERAVSNSFNVGILLGFLLGELPARIAGRLAAEKSETQIQKILEGEIEEIFKVVDRKQKALEW